MRNRDRAHARRGFDLLEDGFLGSPVGYSNLL
jgi:hypothetical protein